MNAKFALDGNQSTLLAGRNLSRQAGQLFEDFIISYFPGLRPPQYHMALLRATSLRQQTFLRHVAGISTQFASCRQATLQTWLAAKNARRPNSKQGNRQADDLDTTNQLIEQLDIDSLLNDEQVGLTRQQQFPAPCPLATWPCCVFYPNPKYAAGHLSGTCCTGHGSTESALTVTDGSCAP